MLSLTMQDNDHEHDVLPALLALLLFGILIIVVTSGGGNSAPRRSSGSSRNQPPGVSGDKNSRAVAVREADTATSIATHAGTSVGRLLELNRSLDPRTLRPGQKPTLAR